MTNEELVELIQSGVNVQENMGILYQQNRPFIRKVCLPFTERAELEDLMQEAYFGLCNAVQGFDASKGYKFISYATWGIRKSCLTYVKNHGSVQRIPEYMQNRISQYKKLIKELNEVPDKKTTMEELNLSSEQYDLLMLTIFQKDVICIDEPLNDDDMTLSDTLSAGTDIEGDYVHADCCEQLWKLMEEVLSSREKNIILNHYKFQKPMEEIASEMGVTASRCYSLEKIALFELKKMDSVQLLAEEFGYDSHIAYSGSKNSVEFLAMKHIEIEQEYERLKENFSLVISDVELKKDEEEKKIQEA